MTELLVRGLIAVAVSLFFGPVVLTVLRRAQVLDHPSERSSHARPVPRGGGAATALAALVALALTPSLESHHRWTIAVASALFGLLGLLDDLVGIPALPRLGIQFLAAVVVTPLLLSDLGGPVVERMVVTVVALFWLVAFVNAYNFMDGIDGISVAEAVGAGVTWFFVGRHAGSVVLAAGGAIVAGAALGFAPYNLPHARMFLGDVGSYFLGAWLAVVAVLGLRAGVQPEAVLAPLALYAADTGTTLVGRVARGERWYRPHRDHAYQRLGDVGWSHVHAAALVGACIGACGALGAVSLTASVPARVAADVGIAGIVAAYLVAPRLVARMRSPLAVA